MEGQDSKKKKNKVKKEEKISGSLKNGEKSLLCNHTF
jgi:hypothetical protein